MQITLLSVGKIKEKYLKDAIAEYTKRLSKYCKLTIIEVADEKTPDTASTAAEEGIRGKEGQRLSLIHILRHFRPVNIVLQNSCSAVRSAEAPEKQKHISDCPRYIYSRKI